MVKVIIVNGKPGCGKTTFERLCAAYDIENISIVSTVDFVKEVAKFCGWNGEKTLKDRKFLSDLKYLLSDWNDIPFQKISEKIEELKKKEKIQILFVDSREPAEIDRFKKAFNAITVLIRRPGDEKIEVSNSADNKVFEYKYDVTILNNFDLETLGEKAIQFVRYLKGEKDVFCN